MSRLLACPFCRELFREDEGVESCPECGLGLRPLASLPPSIEGDEAEIAPSPLEPELPWTHWGYGRGPLILLASLGLAAFFMPWLELIKPEHRMLSGFALARSAAPWLWAGPVAWFVSIPLLVTRRSQKQLCGARLIASLFAAMTLVDVLLLSLIPASSGRRVPVAFEWAWGTWLSGAISLTGIVVAARLGAPRRGTLKHRDASTPTPARSTADRPVPLATTTDAGTTETSSGETLH